jgi:hypothetical protein
VAHLSPRIAHQTRVTRDDQRVLQQERHLTVQKWQIQQSHISRPLREKLPANTEKLKTETDKLKRDCINKRK